MFPCTNGACSSSGEPRFVTPTARFFGTEKLLPQTVLSSQCDLGQCQPSPYLTCSKYLPFMDKWTSSAMAKRCADRYLLRQQIRTRNWISKHYKAGFRDAFQDVANGESGEVPPVPPPKYWNTHYRTEKGKRCVEMYFDGYRTGSALAASEMTTMKTIGASYDWSIEKPKSPCGPSPNCNTGNGGGYSAGGLGQSAMGQAAPTFPQSMPPQFGATTFGPPLAGCQPGRMLVEPPSVFSVGPQTNPPASGIGPPNNYPPSNHLGPAPTLDPGFGQQPNQYPEPPSQYDTAPAAIPQHSQGYTNPVPNLPSPTASGFDSSRNFDLPSPALPTPGYANSGDNTGVQTAPQNQQSLPFNNQPAAGSPQNGPLTPGYSGSPQRQIKPGKLGPPDEFKSDPPAWQYRAPER